MQLEPIRISGLSPSDLESARNNTYPGNLFPSHIAWNSLADNQRTYVALAATLSRGFRATPIEFVQVPKLDETTRPGADMALEDQIVYAALTHRLREALFPGLVEFTDSSGDYAAYRDFERFPLSQTGYKYVLEADAAAFYEYVDHEKLADELIGLTGSADDVDALASLLGQWMTVRRGLPQGPAPSATLADIYISPVDRALFRSGFSFSRFSDDYRILASDWPSVKEAQYTLEGSLRQIGLVVSGSKLRPLKYETYKRFLDKVDESRLDSQAIKAALEDIRSQEGGRLGRMIVAVSNESIALAEHVIRDILDRRRPVVVTTRLARWALRRLGGRSAAAASQLSELLRRFPHLTNEIAQHLVQVIQGSHQAAGLKASGDWLRLGGFGYSWQTGWLLYAASHSPNIPSTISDWSAAHIFDDTMPWFVRGQASIVLAIAGRLPAQRRFLDVFESAPATTRPDLAAAAVLGAPLWASRFLSGISGDPVLAATAHLPRDR